MIFSENRIPPSGQARGQAFSGLCSSAIVVGERSQRERHAHAGGGSMQALGSNGSASWPAGRVRGGGPRPIRFTRAICGDLAQAERREWWIANGLGGFGRGGRAGGPDPP